MKELLELCTMTINHLLKIYLGKIAQCLSIIEIFAHLQLKYTRIVKNDMSTSIMSEFFEKRNLNYNLRSQTDFCAPFSKYHCLWFKVA